MGGSGSPYVGTRDASREVKPDSIEMGTDKLARTDLNRREFYSLSQVELLQHVQRWPFETILAINSECYSLDQGGYP